MSTILVEDQQALLLEQLQKFLTLNMPGPGGEPDASETSVREAIELFRTYNLSVGKRPKTLAWYENSFKHFVTFFEKGGEEGRGSRLDQTVSSLTHADLDQYRLYLTQSGLSVQSINTVLRSLSAFLNWAYKRHHLKVPLVVEKVREGPPRQKEVFSEGEFKRLLAACDTERTIMLRLRARAILYVLYSTGMRASELCGALMKNLYHPIIDGEPAHFLLIEGAKAGGERVVILTEEAWRALEEYRDDLGMPHGSGRKQTGLDPAWVFVSHRNFEERLTVSGLQLILYRLGRVAGVKVHPHKFRHDFATRWVNKDGSEDEDLEVLLKLAGWRSREMLKVYTSYREKTLVRAHRKHM